MIKVRMSLLLFVTLLLSLFIPNIANAHSGLESAKPSAGANVEENIKSIELTFSTKIENLSTLYLINEEGNKLEPASIEVSDNVLKATYQNALDPGTYKVNWNIVGADGHPIEGKYSFTVIESNTTQPNDNTSQEEKINSDDKNEGESKTNENEKDATLNPSEQTSSTDEESFTNVLIIVLVVATLAILAWLFFGKRKK
ncbi:copper resistance CopC family protein [Virgibacillus necropolis]|uniref:CopC domain-containing protein n=1 Tax=Virgibacillus necropolis TaxID=163877 RepID=A0A221MDC4_9BACI|nr:copper resistance protein CopC [Virgibacillus necropolis]ASN05579.1 hypothetical protein CFK40_11445 [Virgibacillus necropolis]